MYCRKCGKQIEDDSVFCKYCGASITPEGSAEKQQQSTRSKLSDNNKIALIAYGIWTLGWLCWPIADDGHDFDSRHGGPLILFLVTVFIPFCIMGGRYVYKLRMKRKLSNLPLDDIPLPEQSDNQSNNVLTKGYTQSSKPESDDEETLFSFEKDLSTAIRKDAPAVISSETLLNFSRRHGKLSVVNKKTNNTYDRYCQFTSEEGNIVRVDFTNRTISLSSKEISEKKYLLSVNKLADGTLCLDFIGRQIGG